MENINQPEYRDIKSLTLWDKNPKSITKKDFERLKRQIHRLGMYKPLIITKDGLVLGGNMRLRAYKELGYTNVWVSVVNADTEAKKLEYALSDNQILGTYEEEDLADLVMGTEEEIPLDDYSVVLKSISLEKLLTQIGPGDEFDVSEEEEDKPKKKTVCPSCGYEFTG